MWHDVHKQESFWIEKHSSHNVYSWAARQVNEVKSYDVGEAKEWTGDVGEAMEELENELWRG